MSGFQELTKNFETVRDYMRGFTVYGFKTRSDFLKSRRETTNASAWRVTGLVQCDNSTRGKVYLSVDGSRIAQNPPMRPESKASRTTTLRCTFCSILSEQDGLSAVQLAGGILAARCRRGAVRLKAREYVNQGVLRCKSRATSSQPGFPVRRAERQAALLDAVCFFQQVAPFGFVGSTLLDRAGAQNRLFRCKHHFIVHTLEDGVLLPCLQAIREGRMLSVCNRSRRTGNTETIRGIPFKILVSTQNGRRYVCLRRPDTQRYASLRLDCIYSVELLDSVPGYEEMRLRFEQNLSRCWGVSFEGRDRYEEIYMKLHIDENTERYVLHRLISEGRGGDVFRIAHNTFLYIRRAFGTNEMLPWIKTFTGRILSLDGTNQAVVDRFYQDMERMRRMYIETEG
ncbi:MAG: WYL domain-containing protein [Oscillospiraceae bacterium]